MRSHTETERKKPVSGPVWWLLATETKTMKLRTRQSADQKEQKRGLVQRLRDLLSLSFESHSDGPRFDEITAKGSGKFGCLPFTFVYWLFKAHQKPNVS